MKMRRRVVAVQARRGAVFVDVKGNVKTKFKFLLMFMVLSVVGVVLFSAANEFNSEAPSVFYESPVENILVEGSFDNVSKERAVNIISGEIKDNFLQINLTALRDILEAIPWVERAIISRQWPNALVVKIVEQKPIARWGEKGFLNQRGEVIHARLSENLMTLPWLFGRDQDSSRIMRQYQDISLLLRSRGLLIDRLWVDAKSTWRISLKNGVDIVLGRDDVFLKLQRFIKVYDQYLIVNMNAIKTIDLRYANGLAVGWSNEYSVKIEGAS